MNDDFKTHVSDINVWKRMLFMLLFAVIYAVSRFVFAAVVLGQLLWLLFTGSKNDKLLLFGGQMASFVYQIYCYLSFNTETRPFPFADWPEGEQATADTQATAQVEEQVEPQSGEAASASEPAASDAVDIATAEPAVDVSVDAEATTAQIDPAPAAVMDADIVDSEPADEKKEPKL